MTEKQIIRTIKKISLDTDHRFCFIANYVLNNLDSIEKMTINQLAKATYTSVATINRFVKFLNLDGYKELVHIIKYFKNSLQGDQITYSLTSNSLILNAYNNIISSLNETFKLTIEQQDTIKNLISKIKNALKIAVFAVGGTFNVAKDFEQKLLRIGFNITAVNDFHNAYLLACQLNKNDLAIFISYSGETLDLIKLAQVCTKNNVQIAVVCKATNNTLSNLSNYLINISSNEKIDRLVSSTSRFSLLFALDLIYIFLLSTDLKKYTKLLEKTMISKF
ncbi:MurR/RpiR family transcriptional regulator [Mycoplasma mycoides]|uniref:MurR/RpiR family transcriptional regulator n=1 Tax=Mycoplasma mycoides subsp. capri TaxID=40477 RepID=A0AB38GDG2_MYCMC|nr:MurR/RpiR family transcriptional regulator [Mycoplasma mycoides]ADH22000.1 transcription regulator GntR [synthetic Mycoplasma mycoides JCVI-syn1.0]ACU78434.1 transcription regulator GntR [Mycoplasma mycoides subsp. capri str. GM12]ACU79264.1 transcription regulator GntR [Mycoplasma mycoides subsp. capri str. GM12]QVK02170.1 MurR/RpiR family transcriptional regulator [Mycoplasma mycoides subsp. capri]QVK05404.1 MurR/RpiR family transcriptional regulator [Mycoplasma mycoides subsp. capri]